MKNKRQVNRTVQLRHQRTETTRELEGLYNPEKKTRRQRRLPIFLSQ